jgi:uncharacterized protein
MDVQLLDEIHQLNPWLRDKKSHVIDKEGFIHRTQLDNLLDAEWDSLWTILIGPRRAGKTTLGKYLAETLLAKGRYEELLYLNCDYLSIRQWLKRPLFIKEAMEQFQLKKPILFIDEVQRLTNPGLLLKSVIDLGLPIKHVATGSSQLEIRAKVQEFLTGRQMSSLVLPLSSEEWHGDLEDQLLYGTYPQVVKSRQKELQLREIYNRYVEKDVIEILKVGQPDILQTLVTLIAHSSGQLINYNQLATDCKVSTTTIRNHLDILEQTFVLSKLTPFVGNKRTEITSNPVYYFIDNGFRNVALRNFSPLASRTDIGLLVESFVFQELHKYRAQHYLPFDLHFWRTKARAEVDFVVYVNPKALLPVEVKYQSLAQPIVPRAYRSFIEAYRPKNGVIVTKDLIAKTQVNDCTVHFIPLQRLSDLFPLIDIVCSNLSR